MIEKEYEGTPELIFYCEYNPNDFDDRLEIPFTNEYDIELDFSRDEDNQVCINVDLQPKESNVPKDFFGKNILNVTAIAGKNGVGKTNILKNLYQLSVRDRIFCLYFDCVNKSYFIETSDVISVSIVNDDGCTEQNKIEEKVKYFFYGIDNISTYDEASRYIEYSVRRFVLEDGNDALLYALLTTANLKLSQDFHKYFRIESSQQLKIIFPLLSEFSSLATEIGIDKFTYLLDALKGRDNNVRYKAIISLSLINYFFEQLQTSKTSKDIPEDYLRITATSKLFVHSIKQLGTTEDFNNFIGSITSKIRIFDWGQRDIFFASLENLPSNFFIENNEEGFLSIQCDIRLYNGDIFNILNALGQLNAIEDNYLSVDIGNFSSGEYALLKQVSSLSHRISSYLHYRKTQGVKSKEVFIICIDEYEHCLHPEWSRLYLDFLLIYLNNSYFYNEKIFFQVILTTHSPYLISDLPKENIILLEKDEKTGKRTARKSNYGFASNYYDIMSDNFFLDDTIGEFAKQKINGCIEVINYISNDLDKLSNDELILHDGLSLFVEDSLKTIEEQNQIIDLVGDKLIQKQLQQLSDSVKQRLLAHSDDAVRKQKIEQDIAELEEKLRQKKMELKND